MQDYFCELKGRWKSNLDSLLERSYSNDAGVRDFLRLDSNVFFICWWSFLFPVIMIHSRDKWNKSIYWRKNIIFKVNRVAWSVLHCIHVSMFPVRCPFRMTDSIISIDPVSKRREGWITSAACAFSALCRDGRQMARWRRMHVHLHTSRGLPHLRCPPTPESHQRRRWRQDALRHIALPLLPALSHPSSKARFSGRTWTRSCVRLRRSFGEWAMVVL